MKIAVLIIIITTLISCQNKSSDQEANRNFNFSTDKIIFEPGIDEYSEKAVHLIVKCVNNNSDTIAIPFNGIDPKTKIESFHFSVSYREKLFPLHSYLSKYAKDTMYIAPTKSEYFMLTFRENDKFEPSELDSMFLVYKMNFKDGSKPKEFKVVDKMTQKIIVSEKLNIEDAVKLVHGSINNDQY